MKSATVIIWDYDLDTDGLNAALAKCERPIVFKVNTDGTRDAVVVCERGTTQEQAQAFYDKHAGE